MTSSPQRRWQAELGLRARHLFWLKLLGTSGWTWLFFLGYFHTQRQPLHVPFVMPLTALDQWVPFEPWALPVYLSLWAYVGIAPGLQRNMSELLAYGAWSGAFLFTGLCCFYLWPTIVPPVMLDLAKFPGFRWMQGVDAAGNACPSMHVAVAAFTGIWLEHLLRTIGVPAWLRVTNLAWGVAIAWSTLATRQHVAIDVGAGALLGAAFAWPSLAWRPSGRVAARRADIIDRLPVDIAP